MIEEMIGEMIDETIDETIEGMVEGTTGDMDRPALQHILRRRQ
jgi:hypothetical protein